MNKYLKLLFVALFATMSFAFSSCNDDDDEPTGQKIAGTWKITELSADNDYFANWPYKTTTITFNSDGTYATKGYFGDATGSWKQNGKKIDTYLYTTPYISYDIISMSASTATFKMTVANNTDNELYIRCKKQ